ncbi:hypothetical protein [Paenibacillus sp. FSL R7-0331]|uniref:hypothetical protein n=1 Tax=Paenibacillus sp. FSL R7-0331 TaxID=1536773 RepID=UPI0004F86E14|nr:hypothetical protein [Paenibacillus sp. FSL R7-0331]AIQ51051.1 hypothetical protein R70331_05655 [Paenibacillus sp. FSL R7-0331]
MGSTIHYEGTAKKVNEVKILRYIEDYARSNKWQINSNEHNSIMVSPHPNCESLVIQFNEYQNFSGFVKTGFATTEIHQQVVRLFYELKPMLKYLSIEDESGYWLEYLGKASGRTAKVLTWFPTLNEMDIVKPELLQMPTYATELDRSFWSVNPNYMKPFMHTPTVRDRMGYDLLNGPYILTAEEMGKLLENEGFTVPPEDWKDEIFYFINLSILWAWKRSTGMKATMMRSNKCIAFGWALARGCHGFGAGYLGQTHRRAHLAIDNLEHKEGEVSPIRSLQILYSLFDFVGLK